MKEVGKYKLTGEDIYQGRFTSIKKCCLESQNKDRYTYKFFKGTSENYELKLIRFVNYIEEQSGVYKIRTFPDQNGRVEQIIPIDYIFPEEGGVGFILPLSTESLRTTLSKRDQFCHSEFDSIMILKQIMMSYRIYYDLKIPYCVLNPGNVLRYDSDYVLTPPSTLMEQPEVLNPDLSYNDYDYLYLAPEILKQNSVDLSGSNETIVYDQISKENYSEVNGLRNYANRFEEVVHKQDIWGLGVLFYRLLFGEFPFQQKDAKLNKQNQDEISRSNWSTQKKKRESIFRWYWYYRHIEVNELAFPENVIIHESVTDLLSKMLEKDPAKRISLGDLKKHAIFKYYREMLCNRTKGLTCRINEISFRKSRILTEQNMRKEYKIIVNKKLRKEIEQNELRMKTLSEIYKNILPTESKKGNECSEKSMSKFKGLESFVTGNHKESKNS